MASARGEERSKAFSAEATDRENVPTVGTRINPLSDNVTNVIFQHGRAIAEMRRGKMLRLHFIDHRFHHPTKAVETRQNSS